MARTRPPISRTPSARSLCATLLAFGCADRGDSGAGDATVTLQSPEADSTVCGAPLHVEVDVRGFRLVPPVSDPEDAEAGTGHVDVMLNGQDADMIWDESTDIEGVADGLYQLKVELSNADHTPITPYAGDLVYITVDDGLCP